MSSCQRHAVNRPTSWIKHLGWLSTVLTSTIHLCCHRLGRKEQAIYIITHVRPLCLCQSNSNRVCMTDTATRYWFVPKVDRLYRLLHQRVTHVYDVYLLFKGLIHALLIGNLHLKDRNQFFCERAESVSRNAERHLKTNKTPGICVQLLVNSCSEVLPAKNSMGIVLCYWNSGLYILLFM